MKTVKLSILKQYNNNPRIGNVDLIAESLEENGQFRPLVVNKDNVILAGNHTYLAMKQLKWKTCDVFYVDVDEKEARKIVLVDNRLSDLASYDGTLIANMLGDLQEAGELKGTGFNADDVDDVLAEFDEVDITDFEKFEGGYALSDEEIENIKEQRSKQVSTNNGKALNDIPIALLDTQYQEFKKMILAIAQNKNINTTEAILISLEARYKKNKSWFNR